jgi:signal transduction histidine kinase
MYYPIKLSFISDTTSSLRIGDPTLGVIRVSNIGESSWSAPRPFHIVDETTLSILAENIYSILEVFTTKQVDGFDRDLAFHAAKTPATGALKNLRLAAQLLFDTSEVDFLPEHDTSVRKQFEITQVGRFSIQDLILAFNNAYALMLNLSSQIDRSNLTDEFHTPYDSVIDKLFSDVLIKSIKLIPYFNASQSELPNSEATSRLIINRIFDLELPPPVMGNGPLLMSVFNNIFENSVKYARRGEPVKIDISWMDDNDFIVISIRDYGIGVPASEVERIFTRGIRTKAAKEHSVRGSGLGLAFCRKVVRSFKGDITAISHETGISVEVRLRKARIL